MSLDRAALHAKLHGVYTPQESEPLDEDSGKVGLVGGMLEADAIKKIRKCLENSFLAGATMGTIRKGGIKACAKLFCGNQKKEVKKLILAACPDIAASSKSKEQLDSFLKLLFDPKIAADPSRNNVERVMEQAAFSDLVELLRHPFIEEAFGTETASTVGQVYVIMSQIANENDFSALLDSVKKYGERAKEKLKSLDAETVNKYLDKVIGIVDIIAEEENLETEKEDNQLLKNASGPEKMLGKVLYLKKKMERIDLETVKNKIKEDPEILGEIDPRLGEGIHQISAILNEI